MKLRVFAVLDTAVGALLRPIFTRSKPEAIRSFVDACREEKSHFGAHAQQFFLMELGEWDDVTGAFSNLPAPEQVISATEALVVEG